MLARGSLTCFDVARVKSVLASMLYLASDQVIYDSTMSTTYYRWVNNNILN